MLALIPDYLKTYEMAQTIGNIWGRSKAGRIYVLDSTFPLYLRLHLAKTDNLCEEGMLFLEQVERCFSVDATESAQDSSWLKSYCLTTDLTLMFVAHKEGICQVVTKQVEVAQFATPVYRTERTVICNE